MTDRTDNFNRANGGLGANWTTRTDTNNVGSLVISGNKVVANATFQDSVAHWSADTFANDQYAQGVWGTVIANPSSACVDVRISGSGTLKYYEFAASTGGFANGLAYYDGTTWNTLTLTGGIANGDTMRISAVGTALTVTINGGATFTSATDANIASGFPGIHIYDEGATASVDDWLGGPIAAAADLPYQPHYQRAPLLAQ